MRSQASEESLEIRLTTILREQHLLLVLDPEHAEIRRVKAKGLADLARQETSANGRHYYIACAKELLEET